MRVNMFDKFQNMNDITRVIIIFAITFVVVNLTVYMHNPIIWFWIVLSCISTVLLFLQQYKNITHKKEKLRQERQKRQEVQSERLARTKEDLNAIQKVRQNMANYVEGPETIN